MTHFRCYGAWVKSESERGPIGAWLVKERERLHLSADAVADRTLIPRASYRGLEAGRFRPTPQRVELLEAVFGSKAPDVTKEPPPAWARALIEDDIPAIRRAAERNTNQLAALQALFVAIQARLPQSHDDPVDDPKPAQKAGKRSR